MTKAKGRPFVGEKIILLKQVPNLDVWLEKPSHQSVVRWATKGCRGVKLESRREGGYRRTSVEAVQRFIARQNGEA